MTIMEIIARLRTLEAAESVASKIKGHSRTQRACHKAAADAYGLAVGLIEDAFPGAAYALYDEVER